MSLTPDDIAKYVTGLRDFTPEEKVMADVNKDGVIDITDALALAKKTPEQYTSAATIARAHPQYRYLSGNQMIEVAAYEDIPLSVRQNAPTTVDRWNGQAWYTPIPQVVLNTTKDPLPGEAVTKPILTDPNYTATSVIAKPSGEGFKTEARDISNDPNLPGTAANKKGNTLFLIAAAVIALIATVAYFIFGRKKK